MARISWKRLLGITNAKRKFAKFTHIPTTRSGRKNKRKNILLSILGFKKWKL